MLAQETAQDMRNRGIVWVCSDRVNTSVETLIRVEKTACEYFGVDENGLLVAVKKKPKTAA